MYASLPSGTMTCRTRVPEEERGGEYVSGNGNTLDRPAERACARERETAREREGESKRARERERQSRARSLAGQSKRVEDLRGTKSGEEEERMRLDAC